MRQRWLTCFFPHAFQSSAWSGPFRGSWKGLALFRGAYFAKTVRCLAATSWPRAALIENRRPNQETGVKLPVIVNKMGGSSLGSPEAIYRSCQINFEDYTRGNNVVLVVSALYGVTNMLEHACHLAAAQKTEELAVVRQKIRDHHVSAAEELLIGEKNLEKLKNRTDWILKHYFDPFVGKMEKAGEAKIGNWFEAVSSLGERLSVPVVCACLSVQGIHAHEVFADNRIIKNGTGPGGVDMTLTTENLRGHLIPMLLKSVVPVVSGFIATLPNGDVTTLGRGGSDLTATLVAAALRADSVNLWKVESEKDEDGFMTAWAGLKEQNKWTGIRSVDPNAVKKSRIVNTISYAEATELTHFGKKVLHSATMAPVAGGNIPIFVRNTALPSHSGTRIGAVAASEGSGSLDNRVVATVAMSVSKYKKMHLKEELAGETAVDDTSKTILALIGDEIRGLSSQILHLVDTVLRHEGIAYSLPKDVPNLLHGNGIRDVGSKNSVSVAVSSADADKAIALLHAKFVEQRLADGLSADAQALNPARLISEGDDLYWGVEASPGRALQTEAARNS